VVLNLEEIFLGFRFLRLEKGERPMTLKKVMPILAIFVVVAASITLVFGQQRPSAAASQVVYPYVQGNQIIGPSGQPLVLRGAHIASAFVFYNSWFHNNDVSRRFSSTILNEMAKTWHMNALRIPLSNWIWAKDSSNYIKTLDQVVQQANAVGLYTILTLHDDATAGSPYGTGACTPKPESVTFWKAIATHYINNPMVIFDAFNEPKFVDGPHWLSGGGTMKGSTGKTAPVIGMQGLVDAIRSVGAKQIVVIGGTAYPLKYSEKNAQLKINDPNIVYTKHWYKEISLGNPSYWDSQIGYFKQFPIYFGEWALLPNSTIAVRCQGATMQNADQLVNTFLNYANQNHMSWTAWQFGAPYLVIDAKQFVPTRLDDPNHAWKCNTPNAIAGMGTVVKQFLLSH